MRATREMRVVAGAGGWGRFGALIEPHLVSDCEVLSAMTVRALAATFGLMVIDDGARELLLAGVATVVATRDERMRPSLQRGWALGVSEDGREVTVCVPAVPGSRMRENLESNGAVAITCSRPTTYRTVQVKGEVVAIRVPTAEQRAGAEAHADAFSREVEELGLPPGPGRRMFDADLIAVTIAVAELYDQTPGPRAGARL
jgi:hypothetical protein